MNKIIDDDSLIDERLPRLPLKKYVVKAILKKKRPEKIYLAYIWEHYGFTELVSVHRTKARAYWAARKALWDRLTELDILWRADVPPVRWKCPVHWEVKETELLD